jgi:hypothetical protein
MKLILGYLIVGVYFNAIFCRILVADDAYRNKSSVQMILNNFNFSSYDFVFGFSTGHVGTSSLSKATMYVNTSNISFVHEASQESAKYAVRWRNGTKEMDSIYVRRKFLPKVLNFKKSKEMLIDMGHHTICFADSLIKYVNKETNYSLLFIRIRRRRLETAFSLMYMAPHIVLRDLSDMMFRYHPYERETEIVLKPPSKQVWMNFTVFQQALWYIDETEMRWQKLIADNRAHLNYLEVWWSSQEHGSFETVVQVIQSIISRKVINERIHPPIHIKVHAGYHVLELKSKESYFKDQDLKYRQMMGIHFIDSE